MLADATNISDKWWSLVHWLFAKRRDICVSVPGLYYARPWWGYARKWYFFLGTSWCSTNRDTNHICRINSREAFEVSRIQYCLDVFFSLLSSLRICFQNLRTSTGAVYFFLFTQHAVSSIACHPDTTWCRSEFFEHALVRNFAERMMVDPNAVQRCVVAWDLLWCQRLSCAWDVGMFLTLHCVLPYGSSVRPTVVDKLFQQL